VRHLLIRLGIDPVIVHYFNYTFKQVTVWNMFIYLFYINGYVYFQWPERYTFLVCILEYLDKLDFLFPAVTYWLK